LTTHTFAKDYFLRCQMRLVALRTLFNQGAYPDVVRESQEIIELLLKGFLRHHKIDPPKWHDVSQILVDNATLFSTQIQKSLPELAEFSKYLRRERENAFNGEDDLIPLEHYDEKTAEKCLHKVEMYIQLFQSEFQ
jgi:HEPN domain-containing protein